MGFAGDSVGGYPSNAFSPYSVGGYSTSPKRTRGVQAEGLGMTKLEDLEKKCSLWRYRVPLSDIHELETVNSKYGDEFMVADTPWRMHLQQRTDQASNAVYLAVHLQCVHTLAGGTYGHFKISIANRDPDKSKGKNFHCHFKKPGSAWGLHHFIQLERLLNPEYGFLERFEIGDNEAITCVNIEILLKVIDPGHDGTYVFGQLPKPSKSLHHKPPIQASLLWPEQDFTDMQFIFGSGDSVGAHRCIIQSRCPKLLVSDGDVQLSPNITPEVFDMFLKFVYSEETPDGRPSNAEAFIDLYQLAIEHDFIFLAEKCLSLCGPLIVGSNVLDLINAKQNELDDPTLQLIFLRVLTSNYDALIEDPRFENLPGKLNRRLSLIMRSKESLGEIVFPRGNDDKTLSSDLHALAKSEANSDLEFILPGGSTMHLHKIVLTNRTSQQWEGSSHQLPAGPEYEFSDSTYVQFFEALYRGTIDSPTGEPLTPELITLTLKMDEELQLTNPNLRKECEAAISPQTSLPLYVLACKHQVPSLADTSKALLSRSFLDKLRDEPDRVWEFMEELSKQGVMDLFKAFTQHIIELQPRS